MVVVRHARGSDAEPDLAPPRPRRGRALLEALAVAAAAVAATVAQHWPQLSVLSTTAPGNLGDPLYMSWQLGWVGHALRTDPGSLWTTNAFLGAPDNLAFSDAMLGYAPLNLLGFGLLGEGQGAALLAFNLAGLFATALALCGGYALARVLGAGILGSLVAGAGFGFAPWRLEQVIHINVVSNGGMALTLACLAYGHGWSLRHGWRPERIRPGWALAGWAVACWQLTLGFAVGIPFVYVLLAVTALWSLGWLALGRPSVPRRLLAADVAGGTAFAVVAVLLIRPYLRVLETHPSAQRTTEMVALFSPPWRGLFTAPDTSRLWGTRQEEWRAAFTWPPEMVLSPGLVLIGLAAVGCVVSVWPLRRRLVLAAATLATGVLALGTNGPAGGRAGYLLLYQHLPGWDALRTPGRLVIWITIGLALLAAGAVARVAEVVAGAVRSRLEAPAVRGARALPGHLALAGLATGTAVVLAAPVVVALEGQGYTRHWPVARSPVDLRTLQAPVFLLPTDLIGDYHMMLWSTEGWPLLANGSSGVDPPSQVALREVAKTFPDAASVAAFRARGIRTVMITRSRAAGTPWEGAADRPVAGLGISRRDLGDGVVYDLG